MRKTLVAMIFSIILISAVNAEQKPDVSNKKNHFINVLAFSQEGKNEVSAGNVLTGRNDFLVAKLTQIIKAPTAPVLRVNNEEYVILQSSDDLAALESANSKDNQLDNTDKNFGALYSASIVNKGNDKKINIIKLSDQAKSVLIEKEKFAIRARFYRPGTKIWGGKAVAIEAGNLCNAGPMCLRRL